MPTYPPFTIRSDLLSTFNNTYKNTLDNDFGIDKEIDIVRISASNKERLFSYIIHNCKELLTEDDRNILNYRLNEDGMSDFVDIFLAIYRTGMNKEEKKYSKIFQFFENNV